MIHKLNITNKNVYIDNVPLLKFLLLLDCNYKNNFKIYTIQNVLFCNISGMLTIYLYNDNSYKLIFTSFNSLTIFDVPNTDNDFDIILNELKYNLAKKYRTISENKYFNKNFKFTLTYNIYNFALLISNRE